MNRVEISYLKEKDNISYLNEKLFTGIRVTYFDSGEIETTAEFEKGKKNGWWIKYNKNGSIYWKSQYRNNVRHGRRIVYWDSDETIVGFAGEYKNGILVSRDFIITLEKEEFDVINTFEKIKKITERFIPKKNDESDYEYLENDELLGENDKSYLDKVEEKKKNQEILNSWFLE